MNTQVTQNDQRVISTTRMFATITTHYTLKIFLTLYLFYFSKMKRFMLIFEKTKLLMTVKTRSFLLGA